MISSSPAPHVSFRYEAFLTSLLSRWPSAALASPSLSLRIRGGIDIAVAVTLILDDLDGLVVPFPMLRGIDSVIASNAHVALGDIDEEVVAPMPASMLTWGGSGYGSK